MYFEKIRSAADLRDAGCLDDAVKQLQVIVGRTNDLDEKIVARLNLATCYMLLGDLHSARTIWQEASDLSTSRIELLPYIGNLDACLLNEEGKIEEAGNRFKQLLRDYIDGFQTPDYRELYEEIRQRLAYVLIKLQRWQEARPILEEALSFKVPAVEKSTILCNLGDCSIMADDYEAAKKYYESAREMGIPKGWEARTHYYLGIAYARLDLFREAKQELGICEANLPEYGLSHKELYQWLSFVSKRLGEPDKAQEYKRLSLIA